MTILTSGMRFHDMHGNVWEWVDDIWRGSYRVIRGGSGSGSVLPGH